MPYNIIVYTLIGIISGLIASSINCYKDSPWENFLWSKFFRSLVVGGFLGIIVFHLEKLNIFIVDNLGILLLAIIPLERLIGEIYKGFFRKNTHAEFERVFINFGIPYKLHFIKIIFGVLFGIVAVSFLAIAITITKIILDSSINIVLSGMLIGFMGGGLIAMGGGIKDSQREGFKFKKFIRSPIVGILVGIILIRFSNNHIFLLLSTAGLERILVEYYKTYYTKYTRGIFEGQKPKYNKWFKKRWIFFLTYLISVLIFIILLFVK